MEETELDIIIIPEGEGADKIYSISSIQIPNVVTQGKTIEEAKNRLRDALKLYLEDLSVEEINLCTGKTNFPIISRMLL